MVNCECGCGGEIPAKHLFRYRAPYYLRGHMPSPECACGCGERLPYSASRKYHSGSYIKGHAKLLNLPKQLCACGCGTETTVHHGRPRKYISGHNSFGRVFAHSEESKVKIRAKRAVQKNVAGIAPHGMSTTPTYKSWISMLWRCSDPRDASFPNYGGRGITVCDRWNPKAGGSFLNFLADMGERPEKKTLDRIDGTKNYEPANCRWATLKEQAANRRNSWDTRRANHAASPS